MHTLLGMLTVFFVTILFAPVVLLASLLRVPERPGSIYERCMRWWARAINASTGTRVVVHGTPAQPGDRGAVYIANHVSWLDVTAIAAVLPRFTFVAKSELQRVPLFGRGASAAGVVFVERENRKSAFESYKVAAREVQRGRNVVVFPEGTRGLEYPLRTFKKGPFVLAIAAGAPVVPTLIYGSRERLPKGSLHARAGEIHLHFLEPVPTAGLTYEDRGKVMERVRDRMARALEEIYGVTHADAVSGRDRASA